MTKPSWQRHSRWVALFALLAFTGPTWAHDSWILAATDSLAEAGTVRVAFVTSERFPTSEYATKRARVREWFTRLGDVKRDVRGFRIEGQELAAEVSLDQPGVHVIAASLHPHFIEFNADHFEGYLADEFARAAAALRHRRGQRHKPGRMYYTKLTKTFVEIGNQPTQDYQKPVGHTLEIIPLSNPCRWSVGSAVIVRVLYEGKPAAKVRVSSGYAGLPPHTFAESVFTDADGQARFKLTRPGLWFLRVHHLQSITTASSKADNPPREDDPPVEWESFWSSITFRVQAQPGE